jgi:hypothetical protein
MEAPQCSRASAHRGSTMGFHCRSMSGVTDERAVDTTLHELRLQRRHLFSAHSLPCVGTCTRFGRGYGWCRGDGGRLVHAWLYRQGSHAHAHWSDTDDECAAREPVVGARSDLARQLLRHKYTATSAEREPDPVQFRPAWLAADEGSGWALRVLSHLRALRGAAGSPSRCVAFGQTWLTHLEQPNTRDVDAEDRSERRGKPQPLRQPEQLSIDLHA